MKNENKEIKILKVNELYKTPDNPKVKLKAIYN